MRWGPRGWSSTIIHLKRQTTHCIHFDDVIYHSLFYEGWKNQVITSQLICEKVKFDGKNLFKEKEISGTLIPSYKISIIMISYRVWVEKINKYFSRNWFHRKDKNVFSWNWDHIWWFERGLIFFHNQTPDDYTKFVCRYMSLCIDFHWKNFLNFTHYSILYFNAAAIFFWSHQYFILGFAICFFSLLRQRITEQRPDGKSSS